MPQRKPLKSHQKVDQLQKKAAELVANKYFALAERELVSILKLQPDNPNALYLYSACLLNKGQTEMGTRLRAKSYELNPCYFMSMGESLENVVKNMLSNLKDTKDNVKQLEDAGANTWVDVVNVFAKHKDLGSCLRMLRLFDKIKKPSSEYSTYIFSNLGLAYYELSFYEESVRMYKTAMDRQPDQFRYYNNSAILFYVVGRYGDSQQYVYQSLTMKPNYAKSLFILAFPLAKTERHQLALEKSYQASSMTPTSIQYRLKIVTILLLHFPTKPDRIVNQLKQIIRLIEEDKDNDEYFFNKDNRPYLEATVKFLMKNLQNQQVEKQDWVAHAHLLDDYLIKGHVDKYKISLKAKKLREKIEEELERIQRENNNGLPEEVLAMERVD